jgi:hypothetical protein
LLGTVVVRRRRSPRFCVCGVHYADMRTGLTFGEVQRLMRDQPDRDGRWAWRQKRRSSVLGYWHELKLQLWDATHGGCEE